MSESDPEEGPSKGPKRKYRQWTEEDLTNAVEAVKTKKLGLNAAARHFNVPKPTVKRYLDGGDLAAKKLADRLFLTAVWNNHLQPIS